MHTFEFASFASCYVSEVHLCYTVFRVHSFSLLSNFPQINISDYDPSSWAWTFGWFPLWPSALLGIKLKESFHGGHWQLSFGWVQPECPAGVRRCLFA